MSKILDLSGSWNYRTDEKMEGIELHFESQSFSDSLILPTTISEHLHKSNAPKRIFDEPQTGYLTDPYLYEGYLWLQKKVAIDKYHFYHLEIERTRISHLWINDKYVGTNNSLIAPHVYDLTSFIDNNCNEITITLMISNVGYPISGGHMTSPDTQTNWLGVLGYIRLIENELCYVTNVYANTSKDLGEVNINAEFITDNSSLTAKITPTITISRLHLAKPPIYEGDVDEIYDTEIISEIVPFAIVKSDISIESGQANFTLQIFDAQLWDDFTPFVYKIDLTLETGSYKRTAYVGFRSFETSEDYFVLNGNNTFLRGKHTGLIYPMTGYAPMDVDSYLKEFSIAKLMGINHYRCHTCCPPEAAFIAADLCGIIFQPELPFWGTYTVEGEENYSKEANEYLERLGFEMLDLYSSHPSYCMMSMGNELWGNKDGINELMGHFKAKYPDIKYTQGSNNFQWTPCILENDDFFSGVRFDINRQIRGSYAMCDAPLGHIQSAPPTTSFNYDEAINPSYIDNLNELKESDDGYVEIQYQTGVKKVKLSDVSDPIIPHIPVINHEIGQYETYPNFDEIEKYTGVLDCDNFVEFKRRLEDAGLGEYAHKYFEASGALAVDCYKREMEAAYRTKHLAGVQLLDLQDFSGQGTALVGVLDAFMENKGLITASSWRQFCGDAVILADFREYVDVSGSPLNIKISLAYFRNHPLRDCMVEVSILNSRKMIVGAGNIAVAPILEAGRYDLGSVDVELPEVTTGTKFTIYINIPGMNISNSYDYYIFPAVDKHELETINAKCKAANVLITSSVEEANSHDGNTLLFLSVEDNKNSIEGTYCTDFWCYPMFRSISESMNKPIPVGTMGLLIDKKHPAVRGMASEIYSTPQWYEIVTASRSTILDDTDIKPIIRTIDNFERNHNLGLLYEKEVNGHKQLICCANIPSLINRNVPEAFQLYKSMCNYLL